MKNNQKGITLIALVVTIIVLLILAGVSIAMLTGQNGILNRASEASINSKIGDAEDIISLNVSDKITDYFHETYVEEKETPTYANLKAAVDAGFDAAKLSINKDDSATGVVITNNLTGTDTLAGNITIKYKGYTATGNISGTALIWSAPVKDAVEP